MFRKFLQQIHPLLAYFVIISVCTFSVGIFAFGFSYISTTSKVLAEDAQTKLHTAGKSVLELHIASDGLVLLRGVNVVSKNGTNMTVTTTWNKLTFTWLIETNESYYGKRHFGTNFFDSHGKNISIDDIRPGDVITVSGMLDTSRTDAPVIKADAIHTSF